MARTRRHWSARAGSWNETYWKKECVIRCRFIFSGKNDELTPDFRRISLTDTGFPPDFRGSRYPAVRHPKLRNSPLSQAELLPDPASTTRPTLNSTTACLGGKQKKSRCHETS